MSVTGGQANLLLINTHTHAQYILSTKVTTNQRHVPHVVPTVQWNALYLIRTSNQWFHPIKGADTFVSLELLVQVMPSIYMEGRSYCCCCSRPNQQIKVVHCRPCNPSIHIQSGICIHCRHCSREEQSREWNGRRRPADGGGLEDDNLQMVMGRKKRRLLELLVHGVGLLDEQARSWRGSGRRPP